jgi:hypothetical protein
MPTDNELTISVPEAGERFFGLSRNGSYAAASRGDIPTIKIGRLLRVPCARWKGCLTAQAGRRGKTNPALALQSCARPQR